MNHPGERPAVHWPRASTRLAGRLFFPNRTTRWRAVLPCVRPERRFVGAKLAERHNFQQESFLRHDFAQNHGGQLSFVPLLRKTWPDGSRLSRFCAKSGRTALVCRSVAQNLGGQLRFASVLRKIRPDGSRLLLCCAKLGRTAPVCCCFWQNRGGLLLLMRLYPRHRS